MEKNINHLITRDSISTFCFVSVILHADTNLTVLNYTMLLMNLFFTKQSECFYVSLSFENILRGFMIFHSMIISNPFFHC